MISRDIFEENITKAFILNKFSDKNLKILKITT